MTSVITTYKRLPIHFPRGQGAWLYDTQGNAYLDGLSGIAVCGLGHAHPEVTRTIQEQSAKVLHVSNGFEIPEQEALADALTQKTGLQQAFFANTGAEANEAAIKLTRLYGHQKGIANPSIIVMQGAFHGRTMGTLSASGGPKTRKGFDPYLPGFTHVPYGDLEAVRRLAAEDETVVAILLETIQGEGGIHVATNAYLQALAELCETKAWLFMVDEVQTGNGRTGALYDCLERKIFPDVLTTAKGLGNGIPISACLMGPKASNLFQPGNHGSTFGGNPFACAVALTVLDVIEREQLCQRAAKGGLYLMQQLQERLASNAKVAAVRGKGYMLGIELKIPADGVREIGLAHRVLFNVTAEKVIRLLPPLIISNDELDMLADRVCATITEFTRTS
ncbi:MAG: aspartate aminotransferase family protein [Legionellaceae bacterium]|nr:aspartate aminotransferase family protein [Legionellaceae bacterium]